MGYRSTVYLGIHKDIQEKFEAIQQKELDSINTQYAKYRKNDEDNGKEPSPFWKEQEELNYFTLEQEVEDGDLLVYSAEDIKWYDDYTFVQEIEALISEDADCIDYEGRSFIIGVGEEGETHTDIGCSYPYVWKSTQLGTY